MDQGQFYELHASCTGAFEKYANEANATATLLAECTAEPLPLTKRLKIALQEQTENIAHVVYLSAKDTLHQTARLGYAFTDTPL